MNPYSGTIMNSSQASITKKHTPIWIPQTSQKIHDSGYGINALVDHAATFFQLLPNLSQHHDENTEILFEQAKQALENIQEAYNKLHYPKDMLLAAHFALCATLDDVVFNYLPYTEKKFSLLQTFHQNHVYEQKFFSLLNYTLERPEQYIDLTELLYLCMLFGFKGRYKNSDFGLTQLQQLLEKTYLSILQARGEHSYQLSFDSDTANSSKRSIGNSKNNIEETKISWLNYLATGTATTIIIFMISTSFHFIYENASPLI